MEESLILSQSEYEHLLEEIHKIQARITELTALRDDLVYHVCPALQAEYDEKIVSLERELMAANMYLKQMHRTIEILQAQMNQQQEPSMEKAEAQAKKENKEFEEDLNRKAEEAREFRKKWEESQWSKHDRQEREAREKEKEDREKEGEAGEKEQKERDKEAGEHNGCRDGERDWDGHNKDREGAGREDGGNGEQEGGNSEGRKQSGDSTGGADKEETAGRSKKAETTADKIRRLYREIVKRLHPDVHPNITEHEKELWNRAVKAQQEGDLAQLEKIWDELSGMDAPEDVFDDTSEGRSKLREMLEKLKIRLRLLELEIDHIKTEFPYKLKAFLEDPIAVEEVRRGIQSKINHVRETNRQLEAFINELKEKIRQGKKA